MFPSSILYSERISENLFGFFNMIDVLHGFTHVLFIWTPEDTCPHGTGREFKWPSSTDKVVTSCCFCTLQSDIGSYSSALVMNVEVLCNICRSLYQPFQQREATIRQEPQLAEAHSSSWGSSLVGRCFLHVDYTSFRRKHLKAGFGVGFCSLDSVLKWVGGLAWNWK